MNIPRNALKAVSLAMANRDVRKYLNGMLIQCSGRTVRLVATDGNRLHMIDLPQEVPCPPLVEGVIIPRALIEWALKNSKPGQSVQITTDGATVTIAAGGASMSGAAVDGRYPDYDRILPRGSSDRGSSAVRSAATCPMRTRPSRNWRGRASRCSRHCAITARTSRPR